MLVCFPCRHPFAVNGRSENRTGVSAKALVHVTGCCEDAFNGARHQHQQRSRHTLRVPRSEKQPRDRVKVLKPRFAVKLVLLQRVEHRTQCHSGDLIVESRQRLTERPLRLTVRGLVLVPVVIFLHWCHKRRVQLGDAATVCLSDGSAQNREQLQRLAPHLRVTSHRFERTESRQPRSDGGTHGTISPATRAQEAETH
ncbi:hypothetical protein DQ04_07301010 [Trypanosoma grayi]|uniref:hypothetical protein n=1 Tax=Trypanosoma grayi TaxID=71804 RepID=UPI0004F4A5AA|nr:hypothetical protein DQ04_07301010 [Trypanosoma grayi]KEG08388.1 hypothetical protein DQ04_07301010 [Trypanosoma grayi]